MSELVAADTLTPNDAPDASDQPFAMHISDEPGRRRTMQSLNSNRTTSIVGIPLSVPQRACWKEEARLGAPLLVSLTARAASGIAAESLSEALRRTVARYEVLQSSCQEVVGLRVPVQVLDHRLEPCVQILGADVPAGSDPLTHARAAARRVLLSGDASIACIIVEHMGRPHVVMSARMLWADAATLRLLIIEAARELETCTVEPEPPLQYGDYVQWLTELQSRDDARPGFDLWRDTLRHPPAEVDCASEPAPTSSPAKLELWLSQDEWAAVRGFAITSAVSLEAPLAAAWRVALGDGGDGERCIGLRLAGREFAEIRDLVGPLAQVIPVAFALDRNRSFADITADAESRISAAREWLDCWSAAAGREAEVPRVQLDLRVTEGDAPSSLTILEEHEDDEAKLLALRCTECAGRLHCALRFDLGYVSREHAALLIERFATILCHAVRTARRPLHAIPQVGRREQETITRFVGSPVARARAASVLSEFRGAVETTPSAPAVACDGEVLSYSALADRARRIASLLRARGARPGDLVPVVFRRTIDLVAGVLGTMLAGCAYVPLDPDYPRDRLDRFVRSTGARCILAQAATAHVVDGLAREVVEVDDAAALAAAAPAAWREAAPDDIAYVIFTSGSTGEPKGVVVSHGNLTASNHARRDLYGGGHPRCLLLQSFAFDSSVAPIFGTVCSGGLLVIASDGSQQDPLAIGALVRRHSVTHLYCNPNVWRLILQEVPVTSLCSLDAAVVAGEACPPMLVYRHFEAVPGVRMINEYGPTEATVWCTAHEVMPEDVAAARVPIGRPVASSSIYVLDERLQPVAVGVVGQLWVGGEGVSVGYLGDPRMTAVRFAPDPFAAFPGARMYATGDRARWLPDGRLDFLGRLDHQLKIRGYRVDPLEIESALSRLDDVEESAVVARHDEYGAQVVAYVAGRPDRIDAAAIRTELASQLPEYMLPSTIVVLSALPRNAHDKVDHAALPAPDSHRPYFLGPASEPANDTECALVAIWRDVLKCPWVGIDDDFFRLGGDSIRIIEVRARAAAAGVHFSIADFMAHRTIRALAGRLPAAPALSPQPAEFALIDGVTRAGLPADVVDAFPLSRLQVGMLFHSAVAERQGVYHDAASYHLRGPCDTGALARALELLVERHEALRLSFDPAAAGVPLQRVHRTARPLLVIEDLRSFPAEIQNLEIDAWLKRERHRPFDWSVPGLVRFAVHQRADDTFQFSWVLHHAILDGWSCAVLLSELFETYTALRRGEYSARPASTVSLRDYLALERASLASGEDADFWRARMCGAEPLLLDAGRRRQRERVQRTVSRTCTVILPRELTKALTELAARRAVSLRTVLLAAHVAVIARFSNRDEIVTGVVSHGRPEMQGGDRLAGLFLNVIPLRVCLAGSIWLELLAHVAAEEEIATPHRRYPLAEIQRAVGGPLFDTSFNFNHFHALDAVMHGELELLDWRGEEETNFTLAATFARDPREPASLHLRVTVDGAVFDEAEAQSVLAVYQRALAGIAADPEREALSALEAPTERAVAVQRTPALAASRSFEGGVLGAFERVLRARPDAEAVWSHDGTWSYAELARRASAYAAAIGGLGLQEDSVVAICMERSREWVAAVLGVLWAGCAYCPVEPGAPPARTVRQCADVGVRAAVTAEPLRRSFAALDTVVDPPPVSAIAFGQADRLDPEALAYVIFTSGSTGRPKGVGVSHRAIIDHLRWRHAEFPLERDARFLQKAACTFDISIWELLAPLTVGATCVLARPEGQRDPEYIAQLIFDQRVTDAHFNPITLSQYIEASGRSCESLRRVFVGGEPLSPALARRFRDHAHARLVHQYGPTETTVDVTASDVVVHGHPAVIPLGKPVAGASTYLLDERLRCVPVGAPGEIFVGGCGIARGYLGDPARTAERFLPDPFGPPGSRMYRTGDRARLLEGGGLRFAGRRDHQVKIRGHRIELGEIEAALRGAPGVHAAVVALHGEDYDRQVVAYVVPHDRTAFDAAALLSTLRASLPEPMVPAGVVTLDALPTTASGKLDRQALPGWQPGVSAQDHVAPRNERERLIASVIARVLGVERPSMTQGFVGLGGDSLSAVRLRATLRAESGAELPLLEILRAPTLAALADHLLAPRERRSLVALRPGRAGATVLMVHPIDGESWWFVELARRMRAGRPIFALESPLLHAPHAGPVTVAGLAAGYADEVRAELTGPYVVAGYSFGGVVAWELARRLATEGECVDGLLLLDAWVTPRVSSAGLTLPIWTAHRAAWEMHNGGPVPCPTTLVQLAARSADERAQQRDGWRDALGMSPAVLAVSGDHDTMLKPPHVDELAHLIDRTMDCWARSPGLITN